MCIHSLALYLLILFLECPTVVLAAFDTYLCSGGSNSGAVTLTTEDSFLINCNMDGMVVFNIAGMDLGTNLKINVEDSDLARVANVFLHIQGPATSTTHNFITILIARNTLRGPIKFSGFIPQNSLISMVDNSVVEVGDTVHSLFGAPANVFVAMLLSVLVLRRGSFTMKGNTISTTGTCTSAATWNVFAMSGIYTLSEGASIVISNNVGTLSCNGRFYNEFGASSGSIITSASSLSVSSNQVTLMGPHSAFFCVFLSMDVLSSGGSLILSLNTVTASSAITQTSGFISFTSVNALVVSSGSTISIDNNIFTVSTSVATTINVIFFGVVTVSSLRIVIHHNLIQVVGSTTCIGVSFTSISIS